MMLPLGLNAYVNVVHMSAMQPLSPGRSIVEVELLIASPMRLPETRGTEVFSDLWMSSRSCLNLFNEGRTRRICDEPRTDVDAVDGIDVDGTTSAVIPSITGPQPARELKINLRGLGDILNHLHYPWLDPRIRLVCGTPNHRHDVLDCQDESGHTQKGCVAHSRPLDGDA